MRTKPDFRTVCAACNQTRRREDLLYSAEDLKPYCANMAMCVESHPNSYKNFAETQKTVPMMTYNEAVEKFRQELKEGADEEVIAALGMLDKPAPVRVKEYEMALYLVQLKEERKMTSMNLTLLSIIEDHMNLNLDAGKIAAVSQAAEQSEESFKQQEQEQQERIEEMNAVNKPVYTPEDEDEDVI